MTAQIHRIVCHSCGIDIPQGALCADCWARAAFPGTSTTPPTEQATEGETELAVESEDKKLLSLALAIIERDLSSAPSFDGYFCHHRKFVAAAKALHIQPSKLASYDGF